MTGTPKRVEEGRREKKKIIMNWGQDRQIGEVKWHIKMSKAKENEIGSAAKMNKQRHVRLNNAGHTTCLTHKQKGG